MRVVEKIPEMQELADKLRAEGRTIGFVPTMGYLHEGHLALVRRAREENDVVVVSIFVNPTQFGPGEDFDRYPRDLERDLRLCERERVDIVFHPSAEEMYPQPYRTYVIVEEITEPLEGRSRPGFFRGVATVVAKLFNIVKPHRAYFGEKDYQQLLVVRQMVKDLNFPIEIVPVPTVREPDGLAMSSRNTYLNPEERKAATALYRGLMAAKALFEKGERDARKLVEECRKVLDSEPLVRVDYVEVCDAEELTPIERVERPAFLAVAAFVGPARLIDGIVLSP